MKVGFTARVQSRCCSRSQNGRSSFGPYCRGFSPQAASASTSRELPRTATAARRPRTLSGGGMGIVSLKEGGEARHRRSRARRDFPTAKAAVAPVKQPAGTRARERARSEEHTSELQSLMRLPYAV